MQAALHLFRLASAACGTNSGFLPNLYDGIGCPDGSPEISSIADILKVAANVTRILIAVSGALAVIVIIVAAIYYIISIGDPGRVKKAKDILTNMALGLLVIMAAYGIVTFIAKGF
jgi:hypothetical protein